MKTRFGFVSNSSSSNYIIVLKVQKASEKCPHCGRSDPNPHNFLEILERSKACDSQVNAVGIDDIIKERLEWNYLGESLGEEHERKVAEFRKILEKYDNGEFIIADVDISYHDEITKDVFNEMRERGDIVVIHDSN